MNIQSLVALTKGQQQPQFSISQDQSTGLASTEESTAPQASTNSNDTSEQFSTFLTLLTAQIRNQDPLAPLDSTQFVEQLATFSNLELQAKGNAVLEDIALMLAQSLYSTTSQVEPET